MAKIKAQVFCQNSMLAYGQYVVGNRAVADFRDGLKPVQRRIVWAMHQLGLHGKFAKSAKAVGDVLGNYHPHGDCLDGSTLVYCLDGTMRRLDSFGPDDVVDVLSVDTTSGKLAPAKARAFRVGQVADVVYRVHLNDGSMIEATGNHPFLLQDQHTWCKAEDIKAGMTLSSSKLADSSGGYRVLDGVPLHRIVAGANSASDVVHHKNEIRTDNRPENLDILSRGEHAAVHKDYLSGLENGRTSMFDATSPMRARIKEKNQTLIRIYNKNQALHKAKAVVQSMSASGIALTEENYNVNRAVVYNAPTLRTLASNYSITNVSSLLSWKPEQSYQVPKKPTKVVQARTRETTDSAFAILSRVAPVIARAIGIGSLTPEAYESARKHLAALGTGFGNVHKRAFPKLTTAMRAARVSTLEDLVAVAGAAIVVSVERTVVPPKPMYDFTVDGYENMHVAVKSTGGRVRLVCVHNSSVYDTLVGMVNARYPVLKGQGNFGSLTDVAAAYRYTEAKLDPLAMLLIGRDNSIVQTQPNFSGTLEEPVFLPAEWPFLLLNGSTGIAVGIASDIPPHQADEVAGALRCMLENPAATLDDVLQHMHGPDYGPNTGTIISPADQIRAMYETGEGAITYRCSYVLNQTDPNQKSIVITGWAPQFGIKKFIERCNAFVESGNLQSVADETSDKNGVKLTLEFSDAAFIQDHILPALEVTVTYRWFINETMPDGTIQTRRTNLMGFLTDWLAYRRGVETQIITAERGRIDRSISNEQAKRAACLKVKKLAELLADGPANLDVEVATLLGITHEQATYILDKVPLRALSRLSVKDLDAKLADLQAARDTCEKNLKKIEKILWTQFAPRNADVRGTLVRVKPPKLVVPKESHVSTWVIATFDGDVTRLDGTPVERRGGVRYDCVECVGRAFWVVLASGQMLRVETASLSVGKPKSFGRIAGIVPTSVDHIAVMDQDGNGLLLDATALVKDKYQSIKTTVPVTRAIGLKRDEWLVAWNDEVLAAHQPDSLQTTRVNSSGWKFLPKRKRGASNIAASTGSVWVDGHRVKLTAEPVKIKEPKVFGQASVLVDWGTSKEILSLEKFAKHAVEGFQNALDIRST